MTKRNRNNRVSVGSANGNTLAGKAQPSAISPQTSPIDVHTVHSLAEFKEVAEKLRSDGYTEVPGALGGGRSGGIGIDYADYIKAQVLADDISIAENDGVETDFDDFKLNIKIEKNS